MKTLRIQEKLPSRKSLVDAKSKFLSDLEAALVKEKTIASHISRVESVPKPATVSRDDIHLQFGMMENFVRHVYEKRTHDKNAEKLQTLIDNAKRELAAARAGPKTSTVTKRTLNIHFRNGVIKPTEKVPANLATRYHWEMQSDAQSWSQIGAKGSTDIRPELSSGDVRLSYRDGKLLSNKIKLGTVIKRQAASAKRKQYRFEVGDAEFEQRCVGVAGRIKRLLKPPRHIVDASFDARVFQDRVAQLPEHLNLDVVDVIDLCETGTTADKDYVHMIEFVEPTIYLNPKKLHSELRDIYDGKRVSLRLPISGNAVPDAAPPPAKAPILMLDEEQDDVIAQAQRRGAQERERRRLAREQQRERARLEQLEREQREQREREDAARREIERKKAEEVARLESERIAREKAEAEAEAREKAERIAVEKAKAEAAALKESERLAREKAEAEEKARQEAERIAREKAEAEEKARRAEEARAEEARLVEQRAAETAARLAREKELLERERQASAQNQMSVYPTQSAGTSASVADAWFMTARGNIYKMTGTGGSSDKVKSDDEGTAEEKANAAGWYVNADAVKLARKQLDNANALAREKRRLEREGKAAAKQAAAEQARLEEERVAQEAAAAAEQARLEEERVVRETAAAAEQARLEEERVAQEAAAAAEQARLEEERVVRETAAAAEQTRLAAEARAAKIQALRADEEQVAFVKYVFTTYDVNANGTIEEIEMVRAYLAGKIRVSSGAGQKVIADNDANGDGAIDVDEFIDWCAVSGVLDDDVWKRAAADFKRKLAAPTVQDFGDRTIRYAMNKVRVGQKFKVKGKTYLKKGSKASQYEPVKEGVMMVSTQQPPGELSAMIENMTDDWVSSDEELNFAEQSEEDSMDFAASSSLDTDSDLDFAQSSERSVQANSSEEESSERGKTSSGMEFAESSAAETDSDMEFVDTSDKTSSGLEFAESSAVESD